MTLGHHRGPIEHELKTWPPFFSAILKGEKRFEIRKDDRGFIAGDTLWLREYTAGARKYTGREVRASVTFLLGGSWPGIRKGYVVMSIAVEGEQL